MSAAATIQYPFTLDAEQLAKVLPHKGEILFARALTVLSHDHYQGTAFWPEQLAAIKGHFPDLPIVPGVYLVEALAQLAGAGLLTGDLYVMSLDKSHIGVLASIRKSTFKSPVLPGQTIDYHIRCRQISPLSVQVSGTATYQGQEVAQLEILLVHASLDQLQLLKSAQSNQSPL